MIDTARFDIVRAEWLALTRLPAGSHDRFDAIKREADTLMAAGAWTSGPSDMLSVLGRHRDELVHSRLIAWLLVPTNRHGFGRRFLTAFVDRIWPEDNLFRSGPVVVDTEESGSALDEVGQLREARADIVLRGDGVTIVIENKVDAGEQPDQCERLYWGWATESGDTRYLFLTPSGREPVTASSAAARQAWRTMSYRELRDTLDRVAGAAGLEAGPGRATAAQYLHTLTSSVVPS